MLSGQIWDKCPPLQFDLSQYSAFTVSEPQRCITTPEALTKASNVVLTMAEYIVAKIKGTIALAGGRAFFIVSTQSKICACWLYLNLEEKS